MNMSFILLINKVDNSMNCNDNQAGLFLMPWEWKSSQIILCQIMPGGTMADGTLIYTGGRWHMTLSYTGGCTLSYCV